VAYYIGIDGGGTKTLCAVGNETELLATATAGPSTLLRASHDVVLESLHGSIEQAYVAAGLTRDNIAAACLGSTGAARPDIVRALQEMLTEILPNTRIHVCGDMEIALAAAFGADPGVVVIAGTGSIAFGRNEEQRTARAGGLGPETSDQGSGHWIGKRAMSVLKNLDPAAAPATLFPAVLAMAKAGDPQAREILIEAGAQLAGLAAVVCTELFGSAARQGSKIGVAMAGGIFRHAALVRSAFAEELTSHYPQADVRSGVVEPAEGALWMARRLGASRPSACFGDTKSF
jgi:glucosamine kinase